MTFPMPQHTSSNVIDYQLSLNHTCTFKIGNKVIIIFIIIIKYF